MAKNLAQERRFYEHQNLFLERNGKTSTSAQVKRVNLNQGYDAYRVSPQIITRNGKKYKKVYGASIEVIWGHRSGTRGTKVVWYENGVVRASMPSGTRVTRAGTIDDFTYGNKNEVSKLRNLLMMKKTKKWGTRARKRYDKTLLQKR